MIDIATQTALEKTWQDDNVITRSASKMKNALNFGQDFGLGSMIVPFVKTPSNIAKAIVDFSPAGFAKAITADAYNFTKAVKNGTVTAQMQNKLAKKHWQWHSRRIDVCGGTCARGNWGYDRQRR